MKWKGFLRKKDESKRGFPTFFILIAAFVLVFPACLIIFLGSRTDTEPQETPYLAVATPTQVLKQIEADHTAVVQKAENGITYQLKYQNPEIAMAGDSIPAGSDVRTWTTDGTAELEFSDGSVVALDENTAIYLEKVSNTLIPENTTTLSIDSGEVLVLSGKVKVRSRNGAFQALSDETVMGISHDPTNGSFGVSCFGPGNNCRMQGLNSFFNLNPGEFRNYVDYILEDPSSVNFEDWQKLSSIDLVEIASQLISASESADSTEATPDSVSDALCDLAELIEDSGFPVGTLFSPRTMFKKTWRLQNVGTCTWDSDYSLVFQGDNIFNAPTSIPLTSGSVAPGESIEISVDLRAPRKSGKHQGEFFLINPSGEKFGIEDGTIPLWTTIEVDADSKINYDFVVQAKHANWESGVGDSLETQITFGGEDESPEGSAKVKDSVLLENGAISGKLLATFPKQETDGVISGTFPEYLIQKGDYLKMRLGMIANPDGTCGNGRVRFRIGYETENEVQWIDEWLKSCDGELLPIDINLSSLQGKTVKIILQVHADGKPKNDWAVWNSPRIER